MTFDEMIAKVRADVEYDPTADHNLLLAAAGKSVSDKNVELLGKLTAANKTLKTLPEGFDIAEYNRLVALETSGKLAEHKGDEQLEALRKQLTTAHDAALVAERAKATGLSGALETEMLDNRARDAITKAGGNPDLLLPHVRSQLSMIQRDDGSYAVSVTDKAGEQRFSVANGGTFMEIPELVSELKSNDTYKPAFSVDNSGGGGGGGGGGKGPTTNPWVKGSPSYNLTEQAKIANTNPGLATQLQSQAALQATA